MELVEMRFGAGSGPSYKTWWRIKVHPLIAKCGFGEITKMRNMGLLASSGFEDGDMEILLPAGGNDPQSVIDAYKVLLELSADRE